MRRLVRSAVIVLLFVPILASANDKVRIAVLDLEITSGLAENLSIPVTDRLRQELFRTGKFTVLERNRMADILEQQSIQMSGCTSQDCAVEIGRILQVRYIVAGSLAQVGSILTVNARMIDVESSEIVVAEALDCSCPIEELYTSRMHQLAARLYVPFREVDDSQSRPAALVGAINVESTPEGASIYLDGVHWGYTPYRLENVTAGRHDLELVLNGYESYDRSVVIERRNQVLFVEADLDDDSEPGEVDQLVDDIKTFIRFERHGGFGGADVFVTRFQDKVGVMVGGSGAWVIDGTWYLGGAGYGFVSTIEGPAVEAPLTDPRLAFGYGGVLIGHIWDTRRSTHFALDVLIAGGAIVHSWTDPNADPIEMTPGKDNESDGIFVFEPAAHYQINVTRWWRIDVTGGWRFVSGANSFGVSNADISGPFAGLNIRFGWWL